MLLTSEKISERLDVLPEELKNILFSQEISKTVSSIQQRYNLEIEQVFEMNALIGEVLMGFEKVDDLRKLILSRGIASDSTIDAIAVELERDIFSRARPFLEQFLGEKILVGAPSFDKPISQPVPGQPRITLENEDGIGTGVKDVIFPSRKAPISPIESIGSQKKIGPAAQTFDFKWEAPKSEIPVSDGSEVIKVSQSQDDIQGNGKKTGPIDLSKV